MYKLYVVKIKLRQPFRHGTTDSDVKISTERQLIKHGSQWKNWKCI